MFGTELKKSFYLFLFIYFTQTYTQKCFNVSMFYCQLSNLLKIQVQCYLHTNDTHTHTSTIKTSINGLIVSNGFVQKNGF